MSGLSVHKIGKRHGVRGQSVHDYLVRLGVTRRTLEASIRKEAIRLDAFRAPLSAEAAYWLGLLYADGGIMVGSHGFSSLGLTAHRDDVESIKGFLAFLGLSGPIRYRSDKRAVSTSVTSKSLISRLAELGCVPRKTHTIRWPNEVTDDLAPHFVRGFLDGDGCINFRLKKRYVTPQGTIKFNGAAPFLADIKEKIVSIAGIPGPKVQEPATRCAALSYEGRTKLLRLESWLYGQGGPCLVRKRDILHRGLHGVGYIACAGEIASKTYRR